MPTHFLGVIMSRLQERIENFDKAYDLFIEMCDNYIENKESNSNRLALTQSFEIVFELGWKVLKDYLKTKGIDVFTPRDTIKEAFGAEILLNAQVWIDMIQDRNASSHEYNQDKVNNILERISTTYYKEFKNFRESTVFNA